MVATYQYGNRITIQVNPSLKYLVYDNKEDFSIVRLITTGKDILQRNFLVIPKEIAKELAKVLMGETITVQRKEDNKA